MSLSGCFLPQGYLRGTPQYHPLWIWVFSGIQSLEWKPPWGNAINLPFGDDFTPHLW